MAECRSCHAPVVWARTAKGKAIPLDVKPRKDGNLILRNGIVRVQTRNDPGGLRYVSHFATCPWAALHRSITEAK